MNASEVNHVVELRCAAEEQGASAVECIVDPA
jgi:hypothetical protein